MWVHIDSLMDTYVHNDEPCSQYASALKMANSSDSNSIGGQKNKNRRMGTVFIIRSVWEYLNVLATNYKIHNKMYYISLYLLTCLHHRVKSHQSQIVFTTSKVLTNKPINPLLPQHLKEPQVVLNKGSPTNKIKLMHSSQLYHQQGNVWKVKFVINSYILHTCTNYSTLHAAHIFKTVNSWSYNIPLLL